MKQANVPLTELVPEHKLNALNDAAQRVATASGVLQAWMSVESARGLEHATEMLNRVADELEALQYRLGGSSFKHYDPPTIPPVAGQCPKCGGQTDLGSEVDCDFCAFEVRGPNGG